IDSLILGRLIEQLLSLRIDRIEGVNEAALAESTGEELGDAVGQIHAVATCAMATLMDLILVCDERKTWFEDGAQSLESWLATDAGIAWRTAAECVRVARAH